MRKFMMILTLAMSFLAVTSADAAKQGPPECSPVCPILR